MFLLTRVPFWYRFFEPQPYVLFFTVGFKGTPSLSCVHLGLAHLEAFEACLGRRVDIRLWCFCPRFGPVDSSPLAGAEARVGGMKATTSTKAAAVLPLRCPLSCAFAEAWLLDSIDVLSLTL